MKLLRRVLPVGVDAAAVRVVLPGRVLVACGDDHGQPAILWEAQDFRPSLAGKLGGAVARAVVDDQDVDIRQLLLQLLEHAG